MTSFDIYWKNYGGFKAILKSFYFWYSILFALLLALCGKTEKWFDLPVSILPNLLGFSIGAYAILLALGDSKFWALLTKEKEEQSTTPFLTINSTFVHFIIIQVVAIIFALLSKVLSKEMTFLNSPYIAFIGMFLLIYAILTTLAATFAILKLSYWYQIYLNNNSDNKTLEDE